MANVYVLPTSIRILVVDDYEPWRQKICSILQTHPELRVVAEVGDGLEAVQITKELKPDLILLDIGLPKLNGIQAALQIQQVSPKSKILFLSENRSREIAEEALRTGAYGYLTKSSAGSELLPAIAEVRQGKQFVTASLVGGDLIGSKQQHIADARDRKNVVAPLPPQNVAIRHEVAFYPDDAAFVDGFARLAEAALRMGNAVIAVAAEPHRIGILKTLRRNGIDVDAALKEGSFIQLDVIDTLSSLMVNDMPDPARCTKMVGDLILKASKRAQGEHHRVAICGECSPTLLADGNVEAAIRLEHLWNEITRNENTDTLCGYVWGLFPRKESIPIFERICAEHSAVVGRELGY
jgi:DNA-binding NarL/FixJ family response regulator